jgi:hypothetical protein
MAAGAVEPHDAPTGLPLELERVLRLPSPLRDSFVLRHMMGLSREECGEFRIDNVLSECGRRCRTTRVVT